MNKADLQQVWSKLELGEDGVFQYKLISEHSIPSLCLGYKGVKKALILELPDKIDIDKYYNHERENISFINLRSSNCLCIVLEDSYFEDLFDDLVLSIYTLIHPISQVTVYTSAFYHTFMKWNSFFAGKHNQGLTAYQLQGLVGELLYLEFQLAVSENINEELKAWRGPYDEGHDFVKDAKDIEVKTISHTSNNVRISSEFQLETVPGKTLELAVFRFIINAENGINLSLIINRIKDQIIFKNGDITIFLKALLQKGIDSQTSKDYDKHKFVPVSLETFETSSEIFPKLTKSNTPDAINSVKYNLNVALLTDFKTTKLEF